MLEKLKSIFESIKITNFTTLDETQMRRGPTSSGEMPPVSHIVNGFKQRRPHFGIVLINYYSPKYLLKS